MIPRHLHPSEKIDGVEVWKLHQSHDNHINSIIDDFGWKDKSGFLRRFDGKIFWPKAEELGHTSMAFENCKCSKHAQ